MGEPGSTKMFLDFLESKGHSSSSAPTTTSTKHILPNIRLMSPSKSRLAVKIVQNGVFVGGVTLLVLVGLQLAGKLDKSLDHMWGFAMTNLVVSMLSSIGMVFVTGRFFYKLHIAKRRGGVLSKRFRRLVVVMAFDLISHTVNSLCYFMPNALVVVRGGRVSLGTLEWFGSIRKTMWNTKFLVFLMRSRMLTPWDIRDPQRHPPGWSDRAVLLDAPLSYHAFLLIYWVALQVPIIGMGYKTIRINADIRDLLGDGNCTVPPERMGYIGSFNAMLLAYQASNFIFILRAYRKLQARPYVLFREVNIMIRYHFMGALYVMDLLLATFFFLFWLNLSSCAGLYMAMFGILPAQIVSTIWTIVNGVFGAPVEQIISDEDNEKPALDMPRLAWSEFDRQGAAAAVGGGSHHTAAEPDFCFETAVKLWYWSLAVYSYIPGERKCCEPGYPAMSFDLALSLYRFTDHEYIHVKESDMHVLIAWSDRVVLVCFRGTYSAVNVKTDFSFARTPHPPKRGNYWMRAQPLIHRGWLMGWTTKGLDHRILNAVIRIVHGETFKKGEARLFVTGHSLGGAMAIVAAFELAKRCGLGPTQVTCYTYGAPRVGNHAFVKEYNSVVPDTWQLVNDQDIVPRMPKFLFLYKHAGQRVIMNGVGDLIVCPFVVEVSFYHIFRFFTRDSANALGQHSLQGYRKALVAVCEAQCVKNKGLNNGKTEIPELLKQRGLLLSKALNINPRSLHLLDSMASGELQEVELV